jgi:hypothetical protein
VPPASGSCGYKDLAAHPASARPESIPTLPGEATEASEPGTVEPASDTTWCTMVAWCVPREGSLQLFPGPACEFGDRHADGREGGAHQAAHR